METASAGRNPDKTPGRETTGRETKRFVLVSQDLGPAQEDKTGWDGFPKQDLVMVAGESPGLKAALVTALAEEGFRVGEIARENNCTQKGGFKYLLRSPSDASKLAGDIHEHGARVGALIYLSGALPKKGPNTPCKDAEAYFSLLKALGEDLKESTRDGGGRVFSVTFMGGCFGLSNSGPGFPEQAALAGITKTLALEWPGILAKHIDLDPEAVSDLWVARLWQEIHDIPGPIEIGMTSHGRFTLKLEEQGLGIGVPPLEVGSVVLLLGGASGITGVTALEMAKRFSSTFVLVGRTEISKAEPEETRDITGLEALRSHFIRAAKFRGESPTPVGINRQIKELMKARQIRAHIEAMEEVGARVEYHALDVRDAKAFSKLIQDVYNRFGRIDGVIHGAGVIEDRLIVDKTPESFLRVYETKVVPARVLTRELKPEALKFMVFFSSISGRYGNPGQCDYSAANEVLNKLALNLAAQWKKTRVVSMGWGPWDGGMVTEDLKKMYGSKNIGLIPMDQGVDLLFREISAPPGIPVEVVVTSTLEHIEEKGLGRIP